MNNVLNTVIIERYTHSNITMITTKVMIVTFWRLFCPAQC